MARRRGRGRDTRGLWRRRAGSPLLLDWHRRLHRRHKVPGVRAALCADAETARGARRWNDANVLCMSLRLTAPTVAEEIIDAWLAAEIDESERANIDKVKAIDADGGD